MIRLYQFKLPNHEPQYVVSTLNVEQIRASRSIWDHGGTSYEIFDKTWESGECKEITSIDQIPKDDRDYMPFETDEKVGSDYLFFDDTIENFFKFTQKGKQSK